MAQNNGRNGPKSIKAMTRGIVGMSMIGPAQQAAQTTAIPQTPAVCTAAVKWKNKINSPSSERKHASDTEPILEKDEKDATEQKKKPPIKKEKSKIWPEMKGKKGETSKGKAKDARNGKIKSGPPNKNGKLQKKDSSSSVPKAADEKKKVTATPKTEEKTDASSSTPTNADTDSTARASLVDVGDDKAEEDSESADDTPRQQQVTIKEKEEEKEEEKGGVTYAENQLITAIPCMPLALAGVCLFLNIFLPGTGTIISSFSVFCCIRKKDEVGAKKEAAVDVMITNFCVGVSQMFTITFFFIGLIWSITWGVFMVQFAWIQHKKEKEEKERLAAISVANAFMIPGMRAS